MSARATDLHGLDALADLEEQRRFLLASLADLQREFDAGDVSADDFETLRDDYTARAAAVLRAIDARQAILPVRRARRWGRTIAGIAVGVGSIGAITAILVNSTAERNGAASPTGGIPGVQTPSAALLDPRIAEAQALEASDPLGALKLYGTVVSSAPDDAAKAIGLTYQGWFAYRLGRQMTTPTDQKAVFEIADRTLREATQLAPDRPDAYCFLAVVRFRAFADPPTAKPALDRCDAGNPPAEVVPLLSNLRQELDG